MRKSMLVIKSPRRKNLEPIHGQKQHWMGMTTTMKGKKTFTADNSSHDGSVDPEVEQIHQTFDERFENRGQLLSSRNQELGQRGKNGGGEDGTLNRSDDELILQITDE